MGAVPQSAIFTVLLMAKILQAVDEDDEEIKSVRFDDPVIETQALRTKRQSDATSDNCAFSVSGDEVDKCSLIISADKLSLSPWRLGVGSSSNWIGGPEVDGSGSSNGGFAFACMSDLNAKNNTAWMFTTPRESTGADGRCLKFKYAMEGLLAHHFSIHLVTYRNSSFTAGDIDSSREPPESEDDNIANSTDTSLDRPPRPSLISVFKDVTDLFHLRESTEGEWVEGKASFSSLNLYSIAFKASADTRFFPYRGFVAVDDLEFTDGPCDNDCLFNQDFCTWDNGDTEDDFDWSLARTSSKRGTGPSRDQSSSASPGLKTGGYAFIDSDFPRRAGDRARLTSVNIPGSDVPLCLTFWTNLYGSGIGTLEVLRQVGNDEETQIWEESGGSGLEEWYPGQLTMISSPGTSYVVIFQASVGTPGAGDIAIDTIVFEDGPCPQMPFGSATGMSAADCSFVVNTCAWTLWQPPTLTTSFTPMLKLVSGSYSNYVEGKTKLPHRGVDYYMGYEMGNYKHRVRDSAYLVSPTIQNNGEGVCLSFWVYMRTHVPTEMKIGSLTVTVATSESNSTVWRLINKQHSMWEYAQVSIRETSPFQIYLQGTKGTKKHGIIAVDDIALFPSDCTLRPLEAETSVGDCSFDTGPCKWKIETPDSTTPSEDLKTKWRYADFGQPLNVLTDHTYGHDKSGFMFIEAFNADIVSQLVSPTLGDSDEEDARDEICLTFYFASFFSDNTAELSVSRRDEDGNVEKLWMIIQASLPPRPEGNVEVEWNYAQVGISIPSQALIEGKVRHGGWAIDDVKFLNGTCTIRPDAAAVVPQSTNET